MSRLSRRRLPEKKGLKDAQNTNDGSFADANERDDTAVVPPLRNHPVLIVAANASFRGTIDS